MDCGKSLRTMPKEVGCVWLPSILYFLQFAIFVKQQYNYVNRIRHTSRKSVKWRNIEKTLIVFVRAVLSGIALFFCQNFEELAAKNNLKSEYASRTNLVSRSN